MNFLQGLIAFLKELRIDREQSDLISHFTRPPSSKKPNKALQLLKVILNKQANTDEEAYKAMGSIFPDMTTNEYKVTKNRLIKKLADLTSLINPNNFPWEAYKKNYHQCYKYLLVTRFMSMGKYQHISTYFGRKAFLIAQKFEFYDLYCNLASQMAMLYANWGDRKQYAYYKDAWHQGLNIYNAEQALFFAYHDLMVHFLNESGYSQQIDELLQEAIEKGERYNQQYESFLLRLYLTRLKSIYYELNYRLQDMIPHWENFEAYLENNPQFNLEALRYECYSKLMTVYINTRELNKGSFYADKASQKFKPGGSNWFHFQEYNFLLLTYLGTLMKAYQVINDVMHNKFFKMQHKTRQERWQLYNGYMAFIIESKWDPEFCSQFNVNEQKFNVAELMKALKKGSQDKQGINAQMLILRFLFNLNRKDHGALINMEEAINTYRYRYLENSTYKQKLNLFMKMLIKVIHYDFDPHQIKQQTNQDYNQLAKPNLIFEGGYEDLEILPFEAVWKWILQQLAHDG